MRCSSRTPSWWRGSWGRSGPPGAAPRRYPSAASPTTPWIPFSPAARAGATAWRCARKTRRTPGEGLRRREVVRTLTPGTVTDPRLLRDDRPTYLLAIVVAEEQGAEKAGRRRAGGADRLCLDGRRGRGVQGRRVRSGSGPPPSFSASTRRRSPCHAIAPPRRADGATHRDSGGPLPGAAAVLRRAFPDEPLGDLPLAQAARAWWWTT